MRGLLGTVAVTVTVPMTVSSGLITIPDISLEGLDQPQGLDKDPLMHLDPPWLPLDMDEGKDWYLLKYIHMHMGTDMVLRKDIHKDHMHMHKVNPSRHGQEATVPTTI